jgi:hypothetical protein
VLSYLGTLREFSTDDKVNQITKQAKAKPLSAFVEDLVQCPGTLLAKAPRHVVAVDPTFRLLSVRRVEVFFTTMTVTMSVAPTVEVNVVDRIRARVGDIRQLMSSDRIDSTAVRALP